MKPLLNIKEVCELLGVCRKTVDRLHRDGFLPKVKVTARTIRFRADDVNRLVTRKTLD